MKDYALITDATCDLPAEVLEKLNVRVIPMEFQIGGTLYQHYPDAREMDDSGRNPVYLADQPAHLF